MFMSYFVVALHMLQSVYKKWESSSVAVYKNPIVKYSAYGYLSLYLGQIDFKKDITYVVF